MIALSALAKQIVYPPIMLMQLVPKIAVAPLFLIWLGFGIESKVLLTVLMTFFPLLLASISGFQILDETSGQGLQADFSITNFSRNEALEEAITVSVTAKVTYSATAPSWIGG